MLKRFVMLKNNYSKVVAYKATKGKSAEISVSCLSLNNVKLKVYLRVRGGWWCVLDGNQKFSFGLSFSINNPYSNKHLIVLQFLKHLRQYLLLKY